MFDIVWKNADSWITIIPLITFEKRIKYMQIRLKKNWWKGACCKEEWIRKGGEDYKSIHKRNIFCNFTWRFLIVVCSSFMDFVIKNAWFHHSSLKRKKQLKYFGFPGGTHAWAWDQQVPEMDAVLPAKLPLALGWLTGEALPLRSGGPTPCSVQRVSGWLMRLVRDSVCWCQSCSSFQRSPLQCSSTSFVFWEGGSQAVALLLPFSTYFVQKYTIHFRKNTLSKYTCSFFFCFTTSKCPNIETSTNLLGARSQRNCSHSLTARRGVQDNWQKQQFSFSTWVKYQTTNPAFILFPMVRHQSQLDCTFATYTICYFLRSLLLWYIASHPMFFFAFSFVEIDAALACLPATFPVRGFLVSRALWNITRHTNHSF